MILIEENLTGSGGYDSVAKEFENGAAQPSGINLMVAGDVDDPDASWAQRGFRRPCLGHTDSVRGEVLRLRVPEALRPLVTRTIRGVVQGNAVYIVPRADGTIVLGATTREDDMVGVRAEGVHQLLRDAHRLVPGILDCEIYEMTAKARPGSPDDVPMVGRVGDGLTVSMGYFRHGILLAAIGSRIGADIVCGTEKDNNPALLAAVNPFRFGNR